jgi:starch phosphorylase
VRLLGNRDHQGALESAARDDSFLAPLKGVLRAWRAIYLSSKSTWYRREHSAANKDFPVAYFSAEFGVTECLPIFAGGLACWRAIT